LKQQRVFFTIQSI